MSDPGVVQGEVGRVYDVDRSLGVGIAVESRGGIYLKGRADDQDQIRR